MSVAAEKTNSETQNKLLSISFGRCKEDTNWKLEQISWVQFVDKLKEVRRTSETMEQYDAMDKTSRGRIKNGKAFVGAELNSGRRKKENVISRSLITLDADFADGNFVENVKKVCAGWAYAVYSTHSHRPDKPKYRVIVPLNRAVSLDEYVAVSRKIAELIGMDYFDKTTHHVHRLMYMPSCSKDADPVLVVGEGEYTDPDSYLDLYDDWKDVTQWPKHKEEKTITYHSGKSSKVQDPRTKDGAIGLFCRAFSIEEGIEKFLESVYEPGSMANRYTYLHGTSVNGLEIYPDQALCFSHQDSDPVADGHSYNLFDLVRIHNFNGDSGDTYRFVNSLPEVQELRAAETIESISNDFGKDNFDESDSEELKYTTPDPYDIKNNMLIKREFRELVSGIKVIEKDVSRIAHIFITKELSNIERNSIHYEIAWKDRGVIKKEIVPGKTISTKKELIDLSDKGLPVNDNNYKHFIDYFDRFIAVNELKQCRMVERLGRINNYFIHPLNSLDIEIVPNGAGEKQLLESFQVKGTVDSWVREVFYRIKDHPKVLFMVLASLASSILQDLKVDTFIVDLSGSTSQGKTTALQVARSVWGTERLVSEWNATKVSIERKASFLNSFPLYLDDTRKANEKIIQPIIYQFSGGSEKGRGSIKGSQREETWNNILLSTGEVPITEYAKRAGGVAARVIPLIDQPFESVDHHYFSDIYKAIDENCGAIGLEFIKNWSEQKESLIPDFHKVKEYYITKSKENEVLTRVSRYYAAVHFTGFILKKIFKLDFNLKSLDRLFDEIARENKALDKPRELLEEILKDLNSSRENILYDYDPRLKTNAIYYKGTIWLLPAYLSEMLGVEERMIRTEWGKRGYILLHDDKKSGNKVDTKLVKRRGKAIRAMCVNPAIIEELGYNFEINYSEEFEEEFNQQLKVTKTLKR